MRRIKKEDTETEFVKSEIPDECPACSDDTSQYNNSAIQQTCITDLPWSLGNSRHSLARSTAAHIYYINTESISTTPKCIETRHST